MQNCGCVSWTEKIQEKIEFDSNWSSGCFVVDSARGSAGVPELAEGGSNDDSDSRSIIDGTHKPDAD